MDYIYKTFQEAQNLIEEGDILLFRGNTFFSFLIKRASQGKYSHVGIASWVKNILECLEFRENYGGRAVLLERQVKEHNGLIDVFRLVPSFCFPVFRHGYIIFETKELNGQSITDCMRRLTGLPYGWMRIWWLFKFHAIGLRLLANGKSLDDTLHDEIVYPVCSTAVAHCIHKNYADVVHHRSNERTEPSDLARSPLLHYLFTLTV